MNARTITYHMRRTITTETPEVNRCCCQIALLNPAYPPELLAARRAEFVRQVREMNDGSDTDMSDRAQNVR